YLPVVDREGRDLRDLAGVAFGVADALARERPGLAEVAASPDGRAVPFARGGGVDRARVRVVHGVVDGPALAERPAQAPVPPVGVALEQEEPLPGSDQQQCPCQVRLTPRV